MGLTSGVGAADGSEALAGRLLEAGATLTNGLPGSSAGTSLSELLGPVGELLGSATEPMLDPLKDYTTVFDSPDGSFSIVAEPLGDEAYGAMILINDSSAPTEYEFELDLPEGATLRETDRGAVEVLDADGEVTGAIRPPQAEDAEGKLVPTSYRVEGNTLIQSILHEGFSYRAAAFQGDCGIVTCTVRLDREWTARARDAAGYIAAGSGACGVAAMPWQARLACAGAFFAAGSMHVTANRYYGNGNCLGIRFTPTPPPYTAAWPVEVLYTTYNCFEPK